MLARRARRTARRGRPPATGSARSPREGAARRRPTPQGKRSRAPRVEEQEPRTPWRVGAQPRYSSAWQEEARRSGTGRGQEIHQKEHEPRRRPPRAARCEQIHRVESRSTSRAARASPAASSLGRATGTATHARAARQTNSGSAGGQPQRALGVVARRRPARRGPGCAQPGQFGASWTRRRRARADTRPRQHHQQAHAVLARVGVPLEPARTTRAPRRGGPGAAAPGADAPSARGSPNRALLEQGVGAVEAGQSLAVGHGGGNLAVSSADSNGSRGPATSRISPRARSSTPWRCSHREEASAAGPAARRGRRRGGQLGEDLVERLFVEVKLSTPW